MKWGSGTRWGARDIMLAGTGERKPMGEDLFFFCRDCAPPGRAPVYLNAHPSSETLLILGFFFFRIARGRSFGIWRGSDGYVVLVQRRIPDRHPMAVARLEAEQGAFDQMKAIS